MALRRPPIGCVSTLPDSDRAQPLPIIDLDVEIDSVTDAAEAMASWLLPNDLVDLLLSAERMHVEPLREQNSKDLIPAIRSSHRNLK